GTCRFRSLDPGSYTIGVEPRPGVEPPARLVSLFAAPGRRYLIRLGGGTIQGHVFDPSGKPWAGTGIQVAGGQTGPGTAEFSVLRRTDADGSYRVSDLPAGAYYLAWDEDGRFDGGDLAAQRRVVLAQDQTLVVDFGSRGVLPVLSGSVRNLAGDPVGGP